MADIVQFPTAETVKQNRTDGDSLLKDIVRDVIIRFDPDEAANIICDAMGRK